MGNQENQQETQRTRVSRLSRHRCQTKPAHSAPNQYVLIDSDCRQLRKEQFSSSARKVIQGTPRNLQLRQISTPGPFGTGEIPVRGLFLLLLGTDAKPFSSPSLIQNEHLLKGGTTKVQIITRGGPMQSFQKSTKPNQQADRVRSPCNIVRANKPGQITNRRINPSCF